MSALFIKWIWRSVFTIGPVRRQEIHGYAQNAIDKRSVHEAASRYRERFAGVRLLVLWADCAVLSDWLVLAMIFTKADRERLERLEPLDKNIVWLVSEAFKAKESWRSVTDRLEENDAKLAAKLGLSHKDLQAGIISLKGQLDGIRDGLAVQIDQIARNIHTMREMANLMFQAKPRRARGRKRK